jgi:short-subunit dehydrogenase
MASPRVVIITGASSGIGRASALQLAERGDHLMLAARGQGRLAAVAAECVALGAPDVLTQQVDVSDRAQVAELFARTVRELGRVDGVVHSAGVAAYGRFADVDPEVLERVMAVNFFGTANVARAALHRFAEQEESGSLVLLGSLLGKIATPYMSPYLASKWAVHGLVRTIQLESRSKPGIGVSLVSPGGVDTPIYRWAATAMGRQGQPPPPVDQPEQVATAIVAALERPRREVSVGVTNAFTVLGFRALPGLFDRLVTPLMDRFGLDPKSASNNPGNVFASASGSTETAYGERDRPHLQLIRQGLNAAARVPRIITLPGHRRLVGHVSRSSKAGTGSSHAPAS